jgi:hypothetical protein
MMGATVRHPLARGEGLESWLFAWHQQPFSGLSCFSDCLELLYIYVLIR